MLNQLGAYSGDFTGKLMVRMVDQSYCREGTGPWMVRMLDQHGPYCGEGTGT